MEKNRNRKKIVWLNVRRANVRQKNVCTRQDRLGQVRSLCIFYIGTYVPYEYLHTNFSVRTFWYVLSLNELYPLRTFAYRQLRTNFMHTNYFHTYFGPRIVVVQSNLVQSSRLVQYSIVSSSIFSFYYRMSRPMFFTRSWCSLLSVFPAGMLPAGEKDGRKPCFVFILFSNS